MRRNGYSFVQGGSPGWSDSASEAGATVQGDRDGSPGWRRYHSLRNMIVILRRNDHPLTAARITVTRGVLKPLASLPFAPRNAAQHLKLNLSAARDALEWPRRAPHRAELRRLRPSKRKRAGQSVANRPPNRYRLTRPRVPSRPTDTIRPTTSRATLRALERTRGDSARRIHCRRRPLGSTLLERYPAAGRRRGLAR